jgi:hypothetical protein
MTKKLIKYENLFDEIKELKLAYYDELNIFYHRY